MKYFRFGNPALAILACLAWNCSTNSTGPGGGSPPTPSVASTSPANQAVNVPVNADIIITFSVPMDTAATEAAISANPAIAGTFAWADSNRQLTWNPGADFTVNTPYTVTVSIGARSGQDVALAADWVFSFTTTVNGGAIVPVVTGSTPADAATNVSVATGISLTFNVPMDVAATEAALSASPSINGTFLWDNGDTKVTWTPDAELTENTLYTITLGAGAQSKAPVAMAAPHVFSFTTGVDPTPTAIEGTIYRKEDSLALPGANIVLYNATTKAPLLRALSDTNGEYRFRVDSGNYYLTVTAQGRIPSPPPGGRYTPFRLDPNAIYTRNFYLRRDSSGTVTGGLTGTIAIPGAGNLSGILVVAIAIDSGADSAAFSTTTGPDGVFVLNNLPVGTYAILGYRSGLARDSVAVQATVIADSLTAGLILTLLPDPVVRELNGSLQFLSTPAGPRFVDVTLVDLQTRAAVPGLSTMSDSAHDYVLRSIPPGTYIAWASYRNDGYVLDPDAVRKFGLPTVTFLPSDTAQTLGFALTNAIRIISPTNPPNSLIPQRLDSLTPYFVWEAYPSTQEYIIEVFDSRGTRIWGGWDTSSNVLHAPILQSGGGVDSVQFNFDGSATEPLRFGEVYSWKIYADADRAPGVQQLISSSEDLMGLFGEVIDDSCGEGTCGP